MGGTTYETMYELNLVSVRESSSLEVQCATLSSHRMYFKILACTAREADARHWSISSDCPPLFAHVQIP